MQETAVQPDVATTEHTIPSTHQPANTAAAPAAAIATTTTATTTAAAAASIPTTSTASDSNQSSSNASPEKTATDAQEPSPFVVVRNDPNLGLDAPLERASHLGFHLYQPGRLLPTLQEYDTAKLVIRIPSIWLTFTNPAVRQRRIWGTDIYTDDSDVVAVLIHTGKLTPLSPHPLLQNRLASSEAGARCGRGVEDRRPDYDLAVTIRVAPRLTRYTGTVRHYLRSRDWTDHDGGSYCIEHVQRIPLGTTQRGKQQRSLRARDFCQARRRALHPV